MSDDITKSIIPSPPPRPEDAAKAVEDVVRSAAEENMPSAGQKQAAEMAASQAPAPQAPVPQAPVPQAPVPQSPVPQSPAPQSPAPQAPQSQAPTPPSAPAVPVSAPPVAAPQVPPTPAPTPPPAPAQQASATMDKVSMPSDLTAPDVSPSAPMPSPSSAPSASLASVEQEFFSGDNTAPSLDMPKVSGPDVSFNDGSSMMADSPPKMRGGMMKVLLPLLFIGAIAFGVFFFFFSGDDAPSSRTVLPSPNEGRIERPASPIPEPVVDVPTPTESIYVKQCREHFNASIAARGENPAAYGEQADAYVVNCAAALEKQAAGGTQ